MESSLLKSIRILVNTTESTHHSSPHSKCNSLQLIATHCDSLHLTATHCVPLHHPHHWQPAAYMTPKSAATYFTIGERLLEMVAVKLVRCHPEILFEANLEGQNLVMDDITYRLEGGGGGYLVEWWAD